jgi:hypothetical protein
LASLDLNKNGAGRSKVRCKWLGGRDKNDRGWIVSAEIDHGKATAQPAKAVPGLAECALDTGGEPGAALLSADFSVSAETQ